MSTGESLLAVLLYAQPQPPALEPLYRQALAEREKALGPKHVKVAASLVDLALFLERSGKTSEAEALLRRARSIYDGKDAVAFATVLAKLSEISGDERLLRESVASHPTWQTVSRLADLRERAGDLKEAEALYRRALQLASRPQEIAASSNNLGLIVATEEAEPLFARAAVLYEKTLGRDHPEFATTLVNLAGAVRARGDLKTAIGMLQNAAATLRSTLGASHPHAQAACAALSEALNQSGRTDDQVCR